MSITQQMIEAGVEALAEFQEGDGFSLADRVAEVFLHMDAARGAGSPSQHGLTKVEGRGDLVAHLEELLAAVRAGKVDAIAVASVGSDGMIGHGWSYMDDIAQPWALLLAAVVSLQHDLLENGC